MHSWLYIFGRASTLDNVNNFSTFHFNPVRGPLEGSSPVPVVFERSCYDWWYNILHSRSNQMRGGWWQFFPYWPYWQSQARKFTTIKTSLSILFPLVAKAFNSATMYLPKRRKKEARFKGILYQVDPCSTNAQLVTIMVSWHDYIHIGKTCIQFTGHRNQDEEGNNEPELWVKKEQFTRDTTHGSFVVPYL